ncbi:A-kinase anchor protein 8-like [Dendropsophus ebraccatus]|uniref:A-kinase anchor protein 8-like n=1 Tax=Dendropsophus ebraccatus TaxID=150705 RepID=UPI003831F9B0
MEWRSGDKYLGGGGFPGGDGYDYTRDSRWSSPGSGISPSDQGGRESYYDRPKRSRNDYPEPDGGYKRQWEQRPPHRGQRGWRGDPRGGFRGYHNKQSDKPIPSGRESVLKASAKNYLFGGGFKAKKWSWKLLRDQTPKLSKRKSKLAEKSKLEESGSKEDGNAEEAAQTMTTEEDQVDGRPEETEHTQSSSNQHQGIDIIRDFSFVNSIQYHCYLCQFRSFHEEEYNLHIQGSFHKEHLEYVRNKLPKSADVLQERLEEGFRKSKEQCKQIKDLNSMVIQIFRNRDINLEVGMDQFIKKVEVIYCDACDMFVSMNYLSVLRHMETPLHKQGCRTKMESSKQRAFSNARNILKFKLNEPTLEEYLSTGKNDEENTRGGCSTDLSQMPCITLSDDEGEEDDDLQGQNSFINDEEKEDGRSECSTEVVPETEESGQMLCSTLPDSEREEEDDVQVV